MIGVYAHAELLNVTIYLPGYPVTAQEFKITLLVLITGAPSRNEAMPKTCTACGIKKVRKEFTKSQWKLPDGSKRTCRDCLSGYGYCRCLGMRMYEWLGTLS